MKNNIKQIVDQVRWHVEHQVGSHVWGQILDGVWSHVYFTRFEIQNKLQNVIGDER
jgi:hypothetical protein